MKTLPREPWRGGQICGWQLEYGVVPGRMVFCGEFKKPGSPLCDEHDKEMREEYGGTLPRFAPGNAMGLELRQTQWGWSVFDGHGFLCSSADDKAELEAHYSFTLSWEPPDTSDDPHGEDPVPATEEEIRAWKESER